MAAGHVHLSAELPVPPSDARELVLDELRLAGFEPRADGERLTVDTGTGLAELSFEAAGDGSVVRLEVVRGPELFGEWFVSQAVVPLLRGAGPDEFGDWLTDRRARRPSGAAARAVYADPLYHRPNFRALLAELELGPEDHLLEVGCGGGAFLHDALESGCSAAAVDHSRDMVGLARERNEQAVAEGRLEVVEADAESLPFADATFTKAVMTGVLGFLHDPVVAFAEIRRVLRPGGLFVALGSDPALRGTPAAPEPMASRLKFYSDDEHWRLARGAGFDEVEVRRIGLLEHARAAGVPEEALPLFDGATPFVVARTSQ